MRFISQDVFKDNIKIDSETADLSAYIFDPKFIKQDVLAIDDCARYVIFKFTGGKTSDLPELYLVLYNFHNGYYSHGFNFSYTEHDGTNKTIIENYL